MEILKKRDAGLVFSRAKTKFVLSVFIISCLMMVPLASAHLGTPVYSKWTTNIPTIDGDISSFSGEWTDATVVYFTFEMRGTMGGYSEDLDAIFYVKNDGSNIYAAVKVLNEEYNALDMAAQWDGLALLFDDDHNGNLENGENGEGATTYTDGYPSPFYVYHDLFHFTSWDADANLGGTEDGALVWTHSVMSEGVSGDYIFEMRIPLTTVPDGDAYDLDITVLPKTVGFKLWFIDKQTHGVYPDNATHTKNHEEVELGGTFGDLVLAGPPPPIVGGVAAPIVIPVNELNLLTPLIWLASAIIFSTALTVVFVKLKKKKL